jgi:hypothetical protein
MKRRDVARKDNDLGTAHDIIQDPMEEATCPFCHKIIRSDANLKVACALCGMGVPHLDTAPQAMTPGGEALHFCCSWCLRIYRRSFDLTPRRPVDTGASATRPRD